MPSEVINIHAAKTRLSELIARVERGERIVIARAGQPVAELGPLTASGVAPLSPDDPLLNLDSFALDGPGGDLSNEDIDRTLYGGS